MREELRRRRLAAGFSQKQLASILGCSRENYCKIERGINTGSMKMWLSIQKALSIEPADILYIIAEGEEA